MHNLEQIAKDINGCAKCKICTHVKNKVIGRGSKHPRIVFVGEAPGKCLLGETKVSLLDGREISIRDIAEKETLPLWTYSCTANGKIMQGKIIKAFKTKIVKKICKVTLDSGETIKCTDNHPFMLRDGTYVQAKDLQIDTSLMPLYREIRKEKYEWYFDCFLNKWKQTHYMDIKARRKHVVHHKDINSRNNSPENLILMPYWDHQRLHQEIIGELWDSPVCREKMLVGAKKGREKAWQNAKWRKRHSKQVSERNKILGKKRTRNRILHTRRIINKILKENSALKIFSEIGLCGDKNRYKFYSRFIVYAKSKKIPGWEKAMQVYKNESYPIWRQNNRQGVRKSFIDKNGYIKKEIPKPAYEEIIVKMSATHKKRMLIPENYLQVVEAAKKSASLRRGKKLSSEHVDKLRIINERRDRDLLGRYLPKCTNHKVVNIEYEYGSFDVYDLEVEKYHNFALSSGIFVHNSEDLVGKPFVGPSGRLLEEWIGHLGLTKKDYAILNICKCRPTDGDDKNRAPTQEEIDTCMPFLKAQIALLKPEIIVTLGSVALKACVPALTETISVVAGNFVEGATLFKPPVYAAFHPAWFLRRGEKGEIYLKNLKEHLSGEKEEEGAGFCETLTINQQKAKNMAIQEMVSPSLSAIHLFAKNSGAIFEDVNQRDECKINNKLCKIIVRGAAEDVDFLIKDEEIDKTIYDYWVIGYSEKGNYNFVGYVDRAILAVTPSRDHFNKGFMVKAVQPASFLPIWKLLPVPKKEKKEEEQIEMQKFIPLHLHTEYSIGDAYGRLPNIGKILKKKGYRACAITDHGTLSGTIYFQKACLENGIKPILGTEGYVVFDYSKDAKKYHLVLLAKNKTGWKNLMVLQDKAVREGFYYTPRMLFSDILEHSEGLICMTACTSGLISKHIQEGQTDKARELIQQLKDSFGEDLYFEIIFNDKVPNQKEVNQGLLKFADEFEVECVVTSDSHYPNKEDHNIHQAIKAISYNKTFEESGFSDETFFYLQDKDVFELASRHPYVTKEKIKQLIANTGEVANKCKFNIEKDWDEVLPEFPVPEDIKDKFVGWCKLKDLEENEDNLLRYIAYRGFHKKGFAGSKEHEDRLELELDRFIVKGYSKYFLIVWDYVNFCKKNDIMVGPGRGSIGSSLASYCMGITELDPIEHNLLFDRFVSSIRKDYPDIDLDFEDAKRGSVIDYLRGKYGEKKCAKVVTFSRWHGKGALRDAGRIFKVPMDEINRITNLCIQRSGGDARSDFTLEDTFTEFEQAKEFMKKYPHVVKIAQALEGSIRHCGVHAAALVVTGKNVFDYIPTHKLGGEIVTAYEKNEVENFGLIKFDILGLKTLSVISKTLKMVRKNGQEILLPTTFDDSSVYEKVFKPGNTLGVFQFETSGMSKLSKQLQIDRFKLLYDASALYRPGALHSGQTATYILRHQGKEWSYEHPLLEPITKDTYGLILYQEDIMEIMHRIGNFSWATSEMSRKIITKSKGKDMFEKLRTEFVENAQRVHGMAPKESGKIFDVVSTFGSYGFNKIHACEYSIISYYCAWLKTYYPREFYSCLLGSEDDSTRFADYIRDAKNSGVKVFLPNVNSSKLGFSPFKKGIIGGFRGIIGIGDKTAEKLVKNQPYVDILDFIRRGKPNLTVFKALLSVGALDEWVENRKAVFENVEELLKTVRSKKDPIKTNAEFFSMVDQTQEDWTEREKAETMLQYYSIPGDKPAIEYYDDPFKSYLQDKYEKIGEMEFDDYNNERWIKGVVTFINFKQSGMEGQWTMFDNVLERRYAHLNVSNEGNVLVHLAPEQYTYYKRYLEKGAGFPVIIKGHSIKDFNKIYCDAMIVLNDIDTNNPVIKYIKFGRRETERLKVKKLFPSCHVEVLEGVTYKVSKNKKAYARMQFTNGKTYLCFKLDPKIFIAGEIVVFHVTQDPFIQIVERL